MNFAKYPVFGVLAGMLLLSALLSACGAGAGQSATPAELVRTVRVDNSVEARETRISGILVPQHEARLSFKTGGIVQHIEVKEGERVSAGQLLASLNLTEIDAQRDQAQEGLTKAKRDYERVKGLFADSVATREQLDNAGTALNIAQRAYDIADYNRSYSEIRAPQSGTVIKKMMNEGELASPGAPVFQFTASDSDEWVLRCGVSDRVWVRLAMGDDALINFDAFPGEVFKGSVSQVGQGSDDATGLYQVEVKLQAANSRFARGLYGRGTIRTKLDGGELSIPLDALVNGHGQDAQVFVIENGKAEPHTVRIVGWEKDTVLISSDLPAGTPVISEGAPWLTRGTPVRVAE